MKAIGNFFRWIALFPAIGLVFTLIHYGLILLITWILNLNIVTIIILSLIGFGFLFGFLHLISTFLSMMVVYIAPQPRIGGIIFGVLALGYGIYGVVGMWNTGVDISRGVQILVSILYIGFWLRVGFTGLMIGADD